MHAASTRRTSNTTDALVSRNFLLSSTQSIDYTLRLSVISKQGRAYLCCRWIHCFGWRSFLPKIVFRLISAMKWWQHIIFLSMVSQSTPQLNCPKKVIKGGGGGMNDEIKVSLPLFSLLYNPAILFEVHQEPQPPKILTPAERTAEKIINKRRL